MSVVEDAEIRNGHSLIGRTLAVGRKLFSIDLSRDRGRRGRLARKVTTLLSFWGRYERLVLLLAALVLVGTGTWMVWDGIRLGHRLSTVSILPPQRVLPPPH